jgi:hypothetical protein
MIVACLALSMLTPAAMVPLYADHAEATSFLKSNWNAYEENYHPNYVLDDNPKTAWVEGVDGDGVGQVLSIPVSTLKSARRVRVDIWNGYQKSKKLLEANGAPKDVTVSVLDARGQITGSVKTTLKRAMGKQSVTVPVVGGVGVVRIVVDSVIAGRVYKDTCISDVSVFVDSDVTHNALAEKAKRGALKAWVKERTQTAAYFAKLPKAYPFASARFEAGPTTVLATLSEADIMMPHPDPMLANEFLVPRPTHLTVKAQLEQPFAAPLSADERRLLRRLIAIDEAGEGPMPEPGTWMASAMKGPALKYPDNLWAIRGWPTLSDVAFFEAKGRTGTSTPVYADAYTDDGEPTQRYRVGSHTSSNAFLIKRPDGSVEAIFVAGDTTTQERGVETTTERRLLIYDAAQHLVAIARTHRSTHTQKLGEDPPVFEVVTLQWDDDKIAVVDVVTTDTAYGELSDRAGLFRRRWTATPTVAAAAPAAPTPTKPAP